MVKFIITMMIFSESRNHIFLFEVHINSFWTEILFYKKKID